MVVAAIHAVSRRSFANPNQISMKPLQKCGGRNCYCLLVALLLSVFASGQSPANPGPADMPGLLNAIEDVMKRQQIPGLMLAIVTKDSVLFAGGLGYSDLSARRKVDATERFRLGSTTKLLVAMGILHLVYEGRLSLDTRLADVAPEVPYHNRWEQTHPIRIINLLEHTSGFTDAFFNRTINLGPTDRKGLDVLELYKAQLETTAKPGTMPAYNNMNYTVLGYLIERVTGTNWPEYLRQNVLLPIGMQHTDFKLRIPNNGEYAQGYYTRDGQQIPVPAAFTLNSNGAHGSMNSCAQDMAKLTRFFLNDWRQDSIQWLPASYLDKMESVTTTLAAQRGLTNGYGLGNHIETWHPKATFHGHGGSIQGFLAHMIYDRKRGIGMAMAKNGGGDDARIATLVMDFLTRNMPLIEPVAKEIPLDSIQPFLGYYKPMAADQRFGFIRNLLRDVFVTTNGNELQLNPMRGWPLPLTHVGGLKFRISFQHDPVYAFAESDDGDKLLMSSIPAGGTHLVKTSTTAVVGRRILLLFGVSALSLSLIMGVLSIIALVLKKLPARQLPLRIIPMLAALSLAFGLVPVLQAERNALSFTEPNGVTLSIFFGTLFFALFALMGIAFLYARWDDLTSRWMKSVMIFTVTGIAVVAFMFLINGMIAPMIWRW